MFKKDGLSDVLEKMRNADGINEKYNWTLFNPEEKKERREKVFPQERKAVFEFGSSIFNE